VVYVDFWASWCGPCKLSFPFMAELARRHHGDLVILTVNEERSREPGQAFIRQVQSRLPVVWDSDGSMGRAWQVNAMPTTLLFDRDGHLRYRHEGFLVEKKEEYIAQVDALIRRK
jgi:cytochrome c biogenesis protein CcmG, thiol:disulfide interchange protein DsbE